MKSLALLTLGLIGSVMHVAAATSPTANLSFNGYSVILALALVGFASARFIRREPKDSTEFI